MNFMASSLVSELTFQMMKQILGISGDELQPKGENQGISLNDLKEQIRIVQDLAIAKRIETADEVEIEEYYENERQGNLGLKGNQDGISLGASGSGTKVVKRVYKFKGYNDKRIEVYEETRDKVLKITTEDISEESNV